MNLGTNIVIMDENSQHLNNLDFSKVFSTVFYNLLIGKLIKYRLDNGQWRVDSKLAEFLDLRNWDQWYKA